MAKEKKAKDFGEISRAEPKVTRIATSKRLNAGKYEQLEEMARRLGTLRAELWRGYGSLGGVGLQQRELRDQWVEEKRQFDTPARMWKETLRDTLGDIATYREAAKVPVRRAIYRHTKEEAEQTPAQSRSQEVELPQEETQSQRAG